MRRSTQTNAAAACSCRLRMLASLLVVAVLMSAVWIRVGFNREDKRRGLEVVVDGDTTAEAESSATRIVRSAHSPLALMYNPVHIPHRDLRRNNLYLLSQPGVSMFRRDLSGKFGYGVSPLQLFDYGTDNWELDAHTDGYRRDFGHGEVSTYHCFDVVAEHGRERAMKSGNVDGLHNYVLQTVCPHNLVNYMYNYVKPFSEGDGYLKTELQAVLDITGGDERSVVGAAMHTSDVYERFLMERHLLTSQQCWLSRRVQVDDPMRHAFHYNKVNTISTQRDEDDDDDGAAPAFHREYPHRFGGRRYDAVTHDVTRRILERTGNFPLYDTRHGLFAEFLRRASDGKIIEEQHGYNFVNFGRRFSSRGAQGDGFITYHHSSSSPDVVDTFACLPSVYLVSCSKGGSQNLKSLMRTHPLIESDGHMEIHYWDQVYINTDPLYKNAQSPANMHEYTERSMHGSAVMREGTIKADGTQDIGYTLLGDSRFPALIHKFTPHARLIWLVRDPVERYVSDFYYWGCRADRDDYSGLRVQWMQAGDPYRKCTSKTLEEAVHADVELVRQCMLTPSDSRARAAERVDVEWQYPGCRADRWGIFTSLMVGDPVDGEPGGEPFLSRSILDPQCTDLLFNVGSSMQNRRGRFVQGLYAMFMESWAKYYRYPEQMFVVKTEDLHDGGDLATTMNEVFAFLNLPPFDVESLRNVHALDRAKYVSSAAVEMLLELHNPWNCYLHGMLGDDALLAWNDARRDRRFSFVNGELPKQPTSDTTVSNNE